MKKILFLGVGRRVELVQAFRNAALVLEKEILIYGEDICDTAPALAFCDRPFRICHIKDERYINELLKKSIQEKIDLIIPTIDTNLLILAENKGRFEDQGINVLISTSEMVKLCRDKNMTSQFFLNCGLKSPMPVNDWRKYKDGYPAFIKPKDGSSSVDAYKVSDEKELETYAARMSDYVVQPFIDGTEYTVDIFADFDGNPVYITPRIRLAVRAGEVLKTQICLDEQIIEDCKKLVETFKPCGPITVQLIRDVKGNDYYIEINPRFGGGSPLSMKAGAKSAEIILRMLDEEKIEYCTDVADGAVFSRFDQSVCITKGNNEIKGVIFDLDDTLYSEKEYVKSGYKVISDYLGGNYENKLWDFFKSGRPAIDDLLKELGRESEKETILSIYRSHKPTIHLYPDVKEILGKLRNSGKKIGIITDGRSEGQRAKIHALGLEHLVDDVIITDELGGSQFRKPCDIAFRIIQTRWRLSPVDLVYIADNPAKDFQSPWQLGIKSIWFKNIDGMYFNREIEANNQTIIIDKLNLVLPYCCS